MKAYSAGYSHRLGDVPVIVGALSGFLHVEHSQGGPDDVVNDAGRLVVGLELRETLRVKAGHVLAELHQHQAVKHDVHATGVILLRVWTRLEMEKGKTMIRNGWR